MLFRGEDAIEGEALLFPGAVPRLLVVVVVGRLMESVPDREME